MALCRLVTRDLAQSLVDVALEANFDIAEDLLVLLRCVFGEGKGKLGVPDSPSSVLGRTEQSPVHRTVRLAVFNHTKFYTINTNFPNNFQNLRKNLELTETPEDSISKYFR